MFIRDAWYVAAWSDEVTTEPLARRICNDPVVLYRGEDGKPAALRDACSHRGAPLSLGSVCEIGIRCHYHGVVFSADGNCVEIPGQDLIPSRAKVRSYPVFEQDQILWIWMGEAGKADVTEIPRCEYHNDSARWPHKHAVLPVKANYLLLVDNLLDATHLAYVHPASVGGSEPGVHYRAEAKLVTSDYGLRLERKMKAAPAPKAYRSCVPFVGDVDRWQEFDFIAPCVVHQYSGAVLAGEDQKTSTDQRFDMRIFHAMTPSTEGVSYYFYSVANGHDVTDPTATDKILAEIVGALDEDKAMVEAQQERIAEFGEDWLVDNKSDATRIAMRRAVKRFEASRAEGAVDARPVS